MNRTRIKAQHINRRSISKVGKGHGIALLSTIWFAALMSISSLAIVKIYQINTETIIRETSNIQAGALHSAAQSYAVFDLLKAREGIATAGVPRSQLVYENGQVPVNIFMQNESAFIDLVQTPKAVLNEAFESLDLDGSIIPLLSSTLSTEASDPDVLNLTGDSPRNMRWLKQIYQNDPGMFEKFVRHTSFYNGAAQINQDVANEQLLRALPELNNTSVNALLEARKADNQSTLRDPVSHPMLSNRASSHYRITTQLTINGQTSRKTHIIKVNLNHRDVFEVVAQL